MNGERMGGKCSMNWKDEKRYKILDVKSKRERPTGESRRRLEDNIVMDLINALPGNSSVNMAKHATIDDAVFSMSSVPRPVLVTDQ
jgi:hypothetical protein